jgi:predicted Holliday junction resolvase-like endonuclease
MTGGEILLAILLMIASTALLVIAFKFFRLKSEFPTKVQERYEAFRNSELQVLSQQYHEIARKEATVQFEQWVHAKEGEIRRDAINRSRVVTIGKVSEQVVPFLPEFFYNPKDARFIGSPIDFIVFDGLDDKELRKVVFIEVKTGNATLTSRERQIKMR